MSKLAERIPAIADTEAKLALTEGLLPSVQAEADGRIHNNNLVDAIEAAIDGYEVNEQLIVEEGRRSMAQQIASAWKNSRVIKLDRVQRVPVFQASFGFEQSYFKVGSYFVPSGSVTIADLEQMLERYDRRIANAETDKSIMIDFLERARPGLERGENLVAQMEAGALELMAVDGHAELEAPQDEE